ncbi:MAG: hypothetical protein HQK87_09640 [Nitrospinae bacterium]|nr:hypothetical protein [Nitrospinota bacterium]
MTGRWGGLFVAPGLVRPPLLAGLLLALGGVSWLFSLPEEAPALLLAAAGVGLACLHPLNTVTMVIVSLPFVLDVGVRNWFWLVEIPLLVALAAGGYRVWRGAGVVAATPLTPPILLALGVTVASFPLDSAGLLHELWVREPGELFPILLKGHTGSLLFYPRLVYNVATGAGLFWLIRRFWPREAAERFATELFVAGLAVSAFAAVAGLLLYADLLPRGGVYLTLSLVGIQHLSVTAFAFNKAFVGQQLSFALCWLIPLTWERRRNAGTVAVALLVALVFAIAILLTRQRVALLAVGGIPLLFLFLILQAGGGGFSAGSGMRRLVFLASPS